MVRRVVTGHDARGRSVVVADDGSVSIPFGTRGGASHLLWGRDDVAHFPDDGSQPQTSRAFPPPGGCQISIIVLPPGGTGEFDEFVSNALAEFAEPGRPGVHSTATLDFGVVLEGTVGLELDDGEVVLHPGDVAVLNGTRHRWHNRGEGVAKWVSINVGARHDLVGDGES